MNKIKCLIIAILSIIFTDNIVSMEQACKKESPLLNLPLEILSQIIEEEKYRASIFNWNDIFEEPIIDLRPLKGLAETSRYLHQFYTNIFNDLKKFKQEHHNKLKDQIKEQYKELSTGDLNKALIDILNKEKLSEENLKEVVKLIIAGADIDATNKYGETALMCASEKGHKNIAQMLIKAKAKINSKNNYGKTALMLASFKNYKETVNMLIKSGADVNTKDNDGYTALMLAALYGYKDIVEILIEAKADVNATDNQGRTALMYASQENRQKVAKMLIAKEANVNTEDRYGYTALIIASKFGRTDIVEMLIKSGANVAKYGSTALMYASEKGYKDIVEILKTAQANTKENYTCVLS